MMDKANIKWVAMSDGAIIASIGEFIKQKRLQDDVTQLQLAKDAGLNRSTIVQIENGESITLASLIQILRALDLLHLLNIFTIESRISPMEYVKMKEKKRLRARKKDTKTDVNNDIGW
ncbi:MAG TPA: helix-turn-helix transcriptional regulator [Tenuifilaceae bacterium]|nr:helix-turn-helix transcriptional regulator [Tenuifilaceae bacterium]HPQ35458.1 helix-turn-helix transcriptional regulator [Tenuifilaceae bacterium]